ncbi:MAG: efflux RND transporter periplasmic adaptor subunit [Aromatoleum sp.]|nr:efflux RND transporter periplasmic adaptor subunit [Aromatoleum sp.]
MNWIARYAHFGRAASRLRRRRADRETLVRSAFLVRASTLAAFAVGFAAVAGCARHEPPPDPVRPVQLTQVALGGTADNAVFAGEIRPRHETDLGFRIAGKLVARLVDVGARVRKGQPLARLDPTDVALQADAAKAQVASTQTEVEFAKAEFERYENLFKQHFVSGSVLDQKRNAMLSNKAKYEQAQAQLAVSRNQAGYATLSSEQDGVITAVNAEAGQVVSAGQSVFKLAREDEREVAISVPENRIGELTRGKPLAVVLWADPQKFYAARVREIAPAVDPVTRTFAVRVSVLEPDPAVQWGMTANVVLRGDGAPTSALLPLSSVYRQDGKPAVWIYDPQSHQVTLRAVTIGQYREDGVIVTSGVAGGDWVVTAGVHKLQPGQVVRPWQADAFPARAAPVAAAGKT